MKFSRLFQPRHPLFWLMLTVNALSFLLLHVVQSRALDTPVTLIVAGFSLCNACLGAFLAWRLLHAGDRKD